MNTTPKDDLPEARILPCPFCGEPISHDESGTETDAQYLRDVGTKDDPCMVPCAKGDPGAILYTRTPAIADGVDENTQIWQTLQARQDAQLKADGVGVEVDGLSQEDYAAALEWHEKNNGGRRFYHTIWSALEYVIKVSTPPQAATDEG